MVDPKGALIHRRAGFALAGLAMAWLASGGAMAAAGGAGAHVGVAALGLWGDQGVFRSEASRAAAILAARYHARPVVVRFNGPRSFAAGPRGMVAALRLAGAGLDPRRDVLVVFLTSHGAPQGIGEKGGRISGLLSPRTLGEILATSPIQRKVLIVSACFSGIFTALAGPDLAVITAADANHPSFGCTAGATWTYFGQAFFADAMTAGTAQHASLEHVFTDAAARVRARELSDGFDPSNPQMAGGTGVLPALDAVP